MQSQSSRKNAHLHLVSECWTVLSMLLLLINASSGFQYKQDTFEDCPARTMEECQASPLVWFECPVTCSEILRMEGSMAEIHEDPEALYQMTVTKSNGQKLSLEDHEGYVTIFAVVPTQYPGMAKFYYDMLEHIGSIYPFTVQFLFLPWQSSDSKEQDNSQNDDTEALLAPQRYSKPHVVLLEAASKPTDALKYLLQANIVAGNDDASLKEDRVTTFLISSDGMYVERLLSPTITLLERRIAVYLQQLSMSREL